MKLNWFEIFHDMLYAIYDMFHLEMASSDIPTLQMIHRILSILHNHQDSNFYNSSSSHRTDMKFS